MPLTVRESRAASKALELLTRLEQNGDELYRLNQIVTATGIGASIATLTPESLAEVNAEHIAPADYAAGLQTLLQFITWLDAVPPGQTRSRLLILRAVSMNI